MSRYPLVLLLPLLFLALLSCAGSNSDLDARVKQLEDSQSRFQIVTADMDSLKKGQLISIIDLIERAEIHKMDEEIQKAVQIDPIYVGNIRRLKRAVTGASWPVPLREKAGEFKEALNELEMALTINDLATSRQALRRCHLAYHPLIDAGWKMIAE